LIYLDASAALKAIVAEAESEALLGWLSGLEDELVSSWLLFTELHCAAAQRPEDVDVDHVNEMLSRVQLIDLARADFASAAELGNGLRTLDALHLTTALRVDAGSIATYDAELAAAARRIGMEVLAPS